MTDINVDRLFLCNHSPKNSCVFLWKHVVLRSAAIVQTAREITRTLQNQRDVFYFSHDLPTPETEPLQTIPHPRARRAGLVLGLPEGMVTGQIGPCIRVLVCLKEKFTSISWRTKQTTNKHGCGSQELDSDNSIRLIYSTRLLIPSAKQANSLNNFTRPF